MNWINSSLILTCIIFLSCGKNDKQEYVDDKPVTHKDEQIKENNTTNQNKDNTNKSGDNSGNDKSSNEKSYYKDEKPEAVISPLETSDYVGKTVTVKGFVADVYKSEKVAYLNFVEKYPDNLFTAVIFASKFSDFGYIQKYKGKNVMVTGRVSMYNKKPQIILNNESQIKISK